MEKLTEQVDNLVLNQKKVTAAQTETDANNAIGIVVDEPTNSDGSNPASPISPQKQGMDNEVTNATLQLTPPAAAQT
jgi:hypothetical protein